MYDLYDHYYKIFFRWIEQGKIPFKYGKIKELTFGDGDRLFCQMLGLGVYSGYHDAVQKLWDAVEAGEVKLGWMNLEDAHILCRIKMAQMGLIK